MTAPSGPSRGTATRPSPELHYRARAEELSALRDRLAARARALSVARVATFLAGLGLWVAADLIPGGGPLRLGTLAAAVAFIVLVRRHRAARRAMEDAEAGIRWTEQGQARLARRWEVLPAPAMPDLESGGGPHPYARDLDLYGPASLASLLGPVHTVRGRDHLARWLLAPSEPSRVRSRQEAVRELAGQPDLLERVGVEGARAEEGGARRRGDGRREDDGVLQDDRKFRDFLTWCRESRPVAPWMRVAAWLLPLATLALAAGHLAGVLSPRWWILTLLVQGWIGLRLGSRFHGDFARVSDGLPQLERVQALVRCWGGETFSSSLLAGNAGRLGDAAAGAFASLRRRVHLADMRLSSLYPLFSVGLLWDFHVAGSLEAWRRAHGRQVEGWMEALGVLEALSALAVLGHDHPDWCYPEVGTAPGESPVLRAESLGHPLLPPAHRVDNDVEVGPPGTVLLVTGSNMSGKSTLLRSLGLAVALGEAGAPVCARTARIPAVALHTSMRVQDSLEAGVSFFMAELLSLGSILAAADREERPLMYLVDEILQGTNSEERQVAGRRLIRHLLRKNAIGAVTTHDLELHRQPEVEDAARLVHFRESLAEDGRALTFDYRLRPGLATTRNALRLAETVGLTDPDDPGGSSSGEPQRSSTP